MINLDRVASHVIYGFFFLMISASLLDVYFTHLEIEQLIAADKESKVLPRVPSETLSTPCVKTEACGLSASQCSFLFPYFAPTSWGAGLTQTPATQTK